MRIREFTMCALLLAGCSTDDDSSLDQNNAAGTRTFAVRIENVAPWKVLKSGTQATKSDGSTGALSPGEMYSITFTAGRGHAINFAAMLGESNDWFFAPGPEGLPLYDESGAPISGNVTHLIALWDAGTEVDQEPAVGDATGPQQPSQNFGAPDPQGTVRPLSSPVLLDDGTSFALPAMKSMIKVMLTPGPDRTFTLTIQNCSGPSTLVTSQGAIPIHISPFAWALHAMPSPLFDTGGAATEGLERIAEDGAVDVARAELAAITGFHTPLSPGVFVVHRDAAPLFTLGAVDRLQGLQANAEDGDPGQLSAIATGTFDTPIGAAMPGPVMPGETYELALSATPGDRLTFVTMYGMSNDWFFSTAPEGLALFEGTSARMGDVTSEVVLYDAGTEVDQEIAIGADTAPQQPAPNTGAADSDPLVRLVHDARYAVPTASHLRVTLEPQ